MNSTKPAKFRPKIVRKVSLRFFEDSANGEWGLTHNDTCTGHNGDDGFNAFWDGRGIFHDVFEHAHEHVDPFFKGYYSMNIGGEIAAMGSLWYFYNICGMSRRLDNPFLGYMNGSPDEITMNSTLDMMQECISEGYCNFGNTLESNVPTQEETNDSGLEWMIQEHFDRLSKVEPKGYDENDKERGQAYKDSVTLEKLANLYRYGYKMAAKLIGKETSWNGDALTGFMSFWNEFCKQNKAEELATRYKGIDFTIYRDKEGLISWKAQFTKHPGGYAFEPCVLKGGVNDIPRVPFLGY